MRECPDHLLAYDFHMLWALGHITAQGENGYDFDARVTLLNELGLCTGDVLAGYYPWSLWVLASLGSLPINIAQPAWIALMTLVFFAYANAGWEWSSRATLSRFLVSIAAFVPVVTNAKLGQSNFVFCLGLLLFLFAAQKGKYFSSGLALSLTLIKFHLFLPLYAAVVFYARLPACRPILYGLFAGFLLQTGLCAFLFPETVFGYPTEFLRTAEASKRYIMPVPASIFASFFGFADFMRAAFSLLGLALGCVYAARFPFDHRALLFYLLPVGLISAPFAWSHTFIALLFPYAFIASKSFDAYGRKMSLFLALFSIPLFIVALQRYSEGEPALVWVPWLMLAGVVVFRKEPEASEH